MPLLRRKKVNQLPIPSSIEPLPETTDRQEFLATPIPTVPKAPLLRHPEPVSPQNATASGQPTSGRARGKSKQNGTGRYGVGELDLTGERSERGRTEFEGVVIESPRLGQTPLPEIKTWQPLRDSRRLLSKRDGPAADDDQVDPEDPDQLLDALLTLKQKQADILAAKRQLAHVRHVESILVAERAAAAAAAGYPPSSAGSFVHQRPRSSRKSSSKFLEEAQQERESLRSAYSHDHTQGPNGESSTPRYEMAVPIEIAAAPEDEPERFDAARVPLEIGNWVEPEVYLIPKTGEIFEDYESYIERLGYYQQPVFACEATGKSGLTFFQALDSEREEAMVIHRIFPPPLRTPILKSVQFFVEGRLDDLVDKVHDRFKDRFYPNEKVFVTLPGSDDKYFGNIQSVRRKSAVGLLSNREITYHPIGTDLWIPQEEVQRRDPADDYEYTVQLFGQEQVDDSEFFKASEDSPEHWGPVTVVASPDQIIRERTQFSKVSLKRLLKESLERDAEMFSPWRLKPSVARAYNVPLEMSDDLRHRIESGREGALQERKAMIRRAHDQGDDAEVKGPPKKKHRKNTENGKEDEGEGSPRAKKDGDGSKTVNKGGRPKGSKNKVGRDELAEERVRAEQEQREREVAAEEDKKKRKKPYKFPAEDLLIELNDREKLAGKPIQKPELNKHLPFPGNFEVFLMTWNFLNAMSKPLKLAQFSIDEFENALYHRDLYTPCALMAEAHAALLNLLRRDVVDDKQEETLPLRAFGLTAPLEGEESDAGGESVDGSDELQEEKLELITEAAGKYAANWMAKDLSPKDHRKGWEGALVGCLWMRSNVKTVPNLVNYLQALLIEDNRPADSRPTWHTEETRLAKRLDYKYPVLHPVFKLEILAFLCELAMQTKRIRDYIEEAALLLTKCRNDQTARKQAIRRLIEERGAIEPGATDALEDLANTDPEAAASRAAVTPDPTMESRTDGDELDAISDLSELDALSDLDSEDGADSKSGNLSGAAARQKAMGEKQLQRDAEQKAKDEQTAKQVADAKAKREGHNEKKRLDDELLELEEQMHELDREFRRQYHAPRTIPIGTDRFGNRVWWFDGCGTADIMTKDGLVIYGTGRLYIQGASQHDLSVRCKAFDIPEDEINERRQLEEGLESLLPEGEWAMIDESEQYRQFLKWLNPKGFRESKLLTYISRFEYAILGGIQQREALYAPEPNEEDQNWAQRPKRGGKAKPVLRGKLSYLSYKNTLAK